MAAYEYNVYVIQQGQATPAVDAWYDSRDICSGGTCSVEVIVDNGSYTLWLAGRSLSGTGTYSLTAFSVNFPLPGEVNRVAPGLSGTQWRAVPAR